MGERYLAYKAEDVSFAQANADLSEFGPLSDSELSLVRGSDNLRNRNFILQFVREGIPLDGKIKFIDDRPTFEIAFDEDKGIKPLFLWLSPKVEQFLLKYLFTGDIGRFPDYFKNDDLPEPREDKEYISKHLKREIERSEYVCEEEEQDGINGIRIISRYPYGSIDYGFMSYSWDDLTAKLENIPAYVYDYEQEDIPELHSSDLPIEYVDLEKGKKLDSVFKEIPSNIILDKTICGCGATWLEIHSKRNSIIIEPNVPVIIGKEQQHKNIIGVYGDKITEKEIAGKIKAQTGYVKIMTTPDSYFKVKKALKFLKASPYKDYFILLDECEKIVSDVDYRQNITLPIDDFFLYEGKAMVSATPIIIDDPRFVKYGFKIIKVRPAFDYKQLLELKPTNNVSAMVKRTVGKLDPDVPICFFYNSIKGIEDLISVMKIGADANIYCSTNAAKELKKDGYKNVYDNVTDKDGKSTLVKYNFFTSRFYSAVDIELDYKPVVIMITQAYKTFGGKTPYTFIDPETEAVQIAGRFRNGVKRLIHITDTNPNTTYQTKDALSKFFAEEHSYFLKLLELKRQAVDDGQKHLIKQAIERVDYFKDGFVSQQGAINYFRYNNAYIDERLKMLYSSPARLNKAYRRCGAFTVLSEAEYAIYTEEDRKILMNKKGPKAKQIELLNDILKKSIASSNFYDLAFIDELKKQYALYVEAIGLLGFNKVKQLGFADSAVRTAVKAEKFDKQIKDPIVIEDVYQTFEPESSYPTVEVNDYLKEIFD